MNLINLNFDFNYKPEQNSIIENSEIESFNILILKAQNDLNKCLLLFLKAQGYSYKELKESGADLDAIFLDNNDYKEFMKLYLTSRNEIQKILYIKDIGYEAKKEIADNIFKVTSYIQFKYPNIHTDENIEEDSRWGFYVFIFIAIIFLLMGINKS